MKNTNDAFSVWLRMCRGGVIAGLAAVTFAVSVVASKAQTNILAAQDTSVQVDLNYGQLVDWAVGGVNQLYDQSFWYSQGNGAVNSISSISPWTTPTLTGGNDPTLTETYANGAVSVETLYTLQSQSVGSGKAGLGTTIQFENVGTNSQTFHVYQYSAFVLNAISGGQSVKFPGTTPPYAVEQTGNGAVLTGLITGVSGGTADSVEEVAGVIDGTQFGLGNGLNAPVFNDTSLTATGSVDFGYEFTATLAPGQTMTISELQSVPEPSSTALVAVGALAVGVLRRRGLAFFKK